MKIEILKELERLKEQHGSPARGRGRRYPDVFKQKMAELMKRGVQLGQLSRATGISVASLQSWQQNIPVNNFKRIDVSAPQSMEKVRIFLGEQVWIELDEDKLSLSLLQRFGAAHDRKIIDPWNLTRSLQSRFSQRPPGPEREPKN